MARKKVDVVSIVDGVKITQCAYRGPKNSETTFPINKSRYTPWAQTVSKYVRGSRGVLGTVDRG
jgi:hypothetical protein